MNYLLPLHIGILALTAIVALYSDHLGFQYLRGKRPFLDEGRMRRLHHLVWAGLVGMMATGFLMFWPAREAYLSYTPFLSKMGFVAVLVLNAFFIGKLIPISGHTPFAQLSPENKTKLLVAGALSSIGWIGAGGTALWYLGYDWIRILFGN